MSVAEVMFAGYPPMTYGMPLLSFLFGRRPEPTAPDALVLTPGAIRPQTVTLAATLPDGSVRTVVADATPRPGAPCEFTLTFVSDETVAAELEPAAAAPPASPPPAAADGTPAAGEVAVVRLPITDAGGEVCGYELVAPAGTGGGSGVTAALLLDAFGDIGLERLAGRHPAWVTLTASFLLEVGTPPVRPDRVVLQVPAEPFAPDVVDALRRLRWSGYEIAVAGYNGAPYAEALLEVCSIAKLAVAGRSDQELAAAIAAPAGRGLRLVATDVASPQELERCRALSFTAFQGDFFAKPGLLRRRRVGTGGPGALHTLAQVSVPDASFEDLERAISSDVGLSVKLLRYVNSAFFALPRTVESVHDALTLLGAATVRRWATVMALAGAANAPEELVELALQRARMCETLGGSDAVFTVGLFSVADALLDAPMDEVLETLPFTDEIRAALLRREGPKGELLETVVAYERGEAAVDAGPAPLAEAYGDAVQWAGEAHRAASS